MFGAFQIEFWRVVFHKGHTKAYREQYDLEWGKRDVPAYGLQIASSDSSRLQNSRTAIPIGSTSLGNYLTDAVAVKKVQFNFCKH